LIEVNVEIYCVLIVLKVALWIRLTLDNMSKREFWGEIQEVQILSNQRTIPLIESRKSFQTFSVFFGQYVTSPCGKLQRTGSVTNSVAQNQALLRYFISSIVLKAVTFHFLRTFQSRPGYQLCASLIRPRELKRCSQEI